MLGLFGTLNMGTRALQAQQTAVEVAGQNLANVNNRAYARQRVDLQTSAALSTSIGSQGTGVEIAGIQQIRDTLLDGQVRGELSVGGFWEAKQNALQSAQSSLGEVYDRTADSTSATSDATATTGLADDLTSLFNAFQSVATTPTSLTSRQLLISQAESLASRFNQTAERLDDLSASLDTALSADVTAANQLLSTIAQLNDRISDAEFGGGPANDLRDLREQRLEELAKLVNIETANIDGSGTDLSVSIGGVVVVAGRDVLDTLQTFDAGNGQLLVRTATAGASLDLTGGTMQGRIDARDGVLKTLQDDLDTLASALITEVNAVHRTGYSLTGSTGADFFTGTDAASISVSRTLKDDPSLIQAAGTPGAVGDNTVALALARLADTSLAGLGNQPFGSAYGRTVASLGNGLADANNQLADHEAVKALLLKQRDSVSGVSLDEEMADLIRFQKAYQASARIVSAVDQMLDVVVNLGR